MNILITGGNGYIGKSLYSSLSKCYNVTSVTRKDFDVSSPKQTSEWLKRKYFDVVIHTAIVGGSRLIKDNMNILDSNLQMYYSLLDNREYFTKFINIGSGAELYQSSTPYGLSKHVIRQSILEKDNFYNVRVFAVFDENELPTRFIKASILNYINSNPIIITQNKYMDFFYMKDFITLVNYYIETDNPAKEIDCAYSTTISLKDIANTINHLDSNRVEIQYISEGLTQHYSAFTPRTNFPFNLYGLETGIELTYEALCNK
jgi:dTDP-4-dehydrorhamnose reductase